MSQSPLIHLYVPDELLEWQELFPAGNICDKLLFEFEGLQISCIFTSLSPINENANVLFLWTLYMLTVPWTERFNASLLLWKNDCPCQKAP